MGFGVFAVVLIAVLALIVTQMLTDGRRGRTWAGFAGRKAKRGGVS